MELGHYRRNIPLRAAFALFICAWACVCVGTGTLAKYIASANISASGSVAAFSFSVGTNKPPFDSNTQDWKVKTSWDEITVDPAHGLPSFDFPLFDSQYKSPRASTVSVQSSDGGMVIAPGTGLDYGDDNQGGAPQYNTNLRLSYPGGPIYTHYAYRFRNDSEVRVNFKIYVDPAPVRALGLPIIFERWACNWNLLDTGQDNADGLILVYDSATFNHCWGDATDIDYVNSPPQWGCGCGAVNTNHDLAPGRESGSIYFEWNWKFESGDDGRDTAYGNAGTGIVSIPILFEVSQAD